MTSVLDQLRAGAEGLEYPSETDAEVTVRLFTPPFPWDAAKAAGIPVTRETVASFFARLRDSDDAPRWHALELVVTAGLKQPAVYRVGEVRVSLFVAGLDDDGRMVGLETMSVET